jgi:hypothetical protein
MAAADAALTTTVRLVVMKAVNPTGVPGLNTVAV